MKTIDEAIEIIEKITPEDITEENAFIDDNCKGCLAGHIWKTEGFTKRHYYNINFDSDKWSDKVFGTRIGWIITNGLENIHMRYAKKDICIDMKPIKFETMKKRALKFLRGMKEKEKGL